MSWGERSCKSPCRWPDNQTMYKCNVNCVGYIWDQTTQPDSTTTKKSNPYAEVVGFSGLNRAQRRALSKKHDREAK
jgi:hypothetical protein